MTGLSPWSLCVIALVALAALGLPIGLSMIGASILYLLLPGQQSAWHVVRSAELWLHQRGGPLMLAEPSERRTPAPRQQPVHTRQDSRFLFRQRLGPRRQAAELRRGQRILDEVLATCPLPVHRIPSYGETADELAALAAEAVHTLTEGPGLL